MIRFVKQCFVPVESLLLVCVFVCLVACSSNHDEPPLYELPESPSYLPGDIVYVEDQRVVVEKAVVNPADGTNTPAENMLDEDQGSICRSKSVPADFDFFFDGNTRVDFLIYTPRTGANGSFGKVEVWGKSGKDDELVLLRSDDWGQPSRALRIDLPEALTTPFQIRIRVKTVKGDGKAICANMDFYKKWNLAFDPYTIFVDKACTQLKKGITEEQINSIEDTFWRNLAMFMYNNWYHTEFRIQTYKPFPDPRDLKDKYYIRAYSLYSNPTGMYTETGDTLVVLAEGISDNQKVELMVRDFEVGLKGNGIGREKSYVLKNGVNIFRPQNKGLIYVQYYAESGIGPDVKLHFASGKVNGFCRLDDSSDNQIFDSIINNAPYGFMDLIGKYAHATFPVNDLKLYKRGDFGDLIKVYDDIVRWEQSFMGLDNKISNKLYFVYDATATNPNGADYRTAYPPGSMKVCCDINKIKIDSWLLGHEAGHVNQLSPGFDWAGMTEVSNNVMSLYVQTMLGVWPRKLEEKDVYVKAFAQMKKGLPQPMIGGKWSEEGENLWSTAEPFVKLVPFWQLYLYCTEIKGKTDFYSRVYEEIRQVNDQWPTFEYGRDDGRYYGQMQLKFAEICCKVAEEDLTAFFEAWGFFQPFENVKITSGNKSTLCACYGIKPFWITSKMIDDTKRRIKEMNLPKAKEGIQYLTDSTVSEYK